MNGIRLANIKHYFQSSSELTEATGGAAVSPSSMAPHVDRFNNLIPWLFGLLDDVLILYAWILLLKQQLDNESK